MVIFRKGILGWIVLSVASSPLLSCSISCKEPTSTDDGPFEDCSIAGDNDNDGFQGCEDPDCVTYPSCVVAYDLWQSAVLKWFRPTREIQEIVDDMNAGRFDSMEDSPTAYIVSVTCAPGTINEEIGTCRYSDNTGSYTTAWLVDEADGVDNGEVILPWEDAFFSIEGSWGDSSGFSTKLKAYSTGVYGDLDGDGYNDVLLSQPVAALGDVLYVWYGGEGKDIQDTFPDFSMSGRDHTRIRDAGDINGDGQRDVVITEGPVDELSLAVVLSGTRYTAETLAAAIQSNSILMTHAPEDIYAWAVAGKSSNLVGDDTDDLAIVTSCFSHSEEVTIDELCGIDSAGISVPVFSGREDWSGIDDLLAKDAWAFHRGADGFGGGGSPTRKAFDIADVNGDGLDDVIVGMPIMYSFSEDDPFRGIEDYRGGTGGVAVYAGDEGGWQGQQNITTGDSVALKWIGQGGEYFADAVFAHDFDGDGYDDILVSDWDSLRPAVASEWDEDSEIKMDIYAGSPDFFEGEVIKRPVAVLLNVVGDDIEKSAFPDEYKDILSVHNHTTPIMMEIMGDLDGGGVADIYIAGTGPGNYINTVSEDFPPFDVEIRPFAAIWSGEKIRDLIVEGKQLQAIAELSYHSSFP